MTRAAPITPHAFALALVFTGLTAACGGPILPPRSVVPADPTPLSKCQIAANQTSPLVTEWTAAEKARLEGMLGQGGVAVRYSGCEMTLLDGCRVEGSYTFQRTTLSSDMLEIRNEDELYAKLPLGAASLEGELERSGRLAVRTTISGQLVFRGDPARGAAGGGCAGATHVITAISVGAFRMASGGAIRAGGDVGVGGVRAGGGAGSAESVLKEAGNPARCVEATESTPHPECGSPIQVFLAPLPPTAFAPPPMAAQPIPPPAEPPPSSPPAEAQPNSTPAEGQPSSPPVAAQPMAPAPWPQAPAPWPQAYAPWPPQAPMIQPHDVVFVKLPRPPSGTWTLQEKGGPPICQLPCAAWLVRSRSYALLREGGEGGGPLALPRLDRVPGSQADVDFQPPRGSKALGIVGIAVGGVGVISGLVLFLAGAREDMGPLPGFLVSTAGLGVTAGGIVYTVYSRSDYKPTYRSASSPEVAPGPRVGIGLGGIVGDF